MVTDLLVEFLALWIAIVPVYITSNIRLQILKEKYHGRMPTNCSLKECCQIPFFDGSLCICYPSFPLQYKFWKLKSLPYQETRIRQEGLQWHVSTCISVLVGGGGYFCPHPQSALGSAQRQGIHEFCVSMSSPTSTTCSKVVLKHSLN